MTTKLTKQADKLAKAWMKGPSPFDRYDSHALRDYIDLCTGGDLDMIQLNILFDMVWKRLPQGPGLNRVA